MSTALQLDLAKLLLIDKEAEDPRWILDSVRRELSAAEYKLVEDLGNRFTKSRQPLGRGRVGPGCGFLDPTASHDCTSLLHESDGVPQCGTDM